MSQLLNFYRVFIIAITILSVCIASHVNAADSDNFSLTVDEGKPAANPDPAAVNEAVTFRFTVSLFDSQGKRLEEVPAEVKTIQYTITSCNHGLIISTSPNMSLSSDKKSATGTARHLYSSITSNTKFSQTGNHSLTLSVTVIFNDDSTLSSSHSINVDVVDATFSVYACPPPLRKKTIIGVRHFYGEVGHSFWKIAIDTNLLLPDENLDLPNHPNIKIANHAEGFYPQAGMKNHLIDYVTPVNGTVGLDDGHAWYSSISSQITPSNAKNAIAKVVAVNSNQYSVITIGGKNCTSQSSVIAGVAGCNPPNGNGLVHYHAFRISPTDPTDPSDPNGLYGPGIKWRCANPYTHAVQISQHSDGIINPDYSGSTNALD
ncbi:MAG: hypothetical protein LBG58_11070 [Planctomycetaceae bacterium]|jgi:hypothetical protein|nr:hypothetical protein [Planctomycetaceae bacterium]